MGGCHRLRPIILQPQLRGSTRRRRQANDGQRAAIGRRTGGCEGIVVGPAGCWTAAPFGNNLGRTVRALHSDGSRHAMTKPAESHEASGRLALYEKLVATVPGIDRRGATIPYTSLN